jgi:hypothetical protein
MIYAARESKYSAICCRRSDTSIVEALTLRGRQPTTLDIMATAVYVAMARGTEMLERRRGWNMHWTPVGLGDDDLAGRRRAKRWRRAG